MKTAKTKMPTAVTDMPDVLSVGDRQIEREGKRNRERMRGEKETHKEEQVDNEIQDERKEEERKKRAGERKKEEEESPTMTAWTYHASTREAR